MKYLILLMTLVLSIGTAYAGKEYNGDRRHSISRHSTHAKGKEGDKPKPEHPFPHPHFKDTWWYDYNPPKPQHGRSGWQPYQPPHINQF